MKNNVRINPAIIISFSITLLGFFFKQPYLWIPLSVLATGIIDLFTRRWVMSDRLGSARTLSIMLKSLFSLIGFYAMLGQIVCIGLAIWWLFF